MNNNGFNFFMISIISILYILFVTKLAEIISINYDDDDEEKQIGTYVMIIYFISIIGIVAGYIWLNNNKSESKSADLIMRWSLSIGGIILLIYTIINYWDFLGNYAKLSLLILSITCIIYYIYKFM